MSTITFTPPPALTGTRCSLLTDMIVLALEGPDSAQFLHGQLTADIERLTPGHWLHAGYCTPKGRLLATLRVWRDEARIFLLLPADLGEIIVRRLKMFMLRAKTHIAPTTLAITGISAPDLVQATTLLPQPGQTARLEALGTLLLRLPDAGTLQHALAVGDQPFVTDGCAIVSPAVWRAADILAGVPLVTAATSEKFVPQMINYELIGGVNFRKGCYPGQEIVARSQYLGAVKRRMLPFVLPAGTIASVGDELFSSSDSSQPCGMIVNVAPSHNGEALLGLAEIKLAARESTVRLATASHDGTALAWLQPPYDIDTDITA